MARLVAKRILIVATLFLLVAQACTNDAMAQSPAKVALLVGVNTYERRGFRDLEVAERDIEEFSAVLKAAQFDVTLLTGKNATLARIQAATKQLLTDRKKSDLVLIGLAGHGIQMEVKGIDGKLQ